ncbi:hypothetical protein R3P38DRAFT_2776624 [Favolaschia claudopus]|uniref:Uncharacterized protein n=1 Tax=Favolaschia claudopus TaxID=2862362 RepID=A0AAW0BMM1_9AGAR
MNTSAESSALGSFTTSTPPPNSSFDFHLPDDYSELSIEALREFPALQSPEQGAGSNLVFPNVGGDLPDEDAAEVLADPGADDDSDEGDEGDGDDEFDESDMIVDPRAQPQSHNPDSDSEEDQLEWSSPVRVPNNGKGPLRADGSHSSGFRLPPRREEVQSGGGHKHREASPLPPDQQPTTRLRPSIKPSARTNDEAFAIHHQRAKASTSALAAAPVVAPVPVVPAAARHDDAVATALNEVVEPPPRLDLARLQGKPPQRATPPPGAPRVAALQRPGPPPTRASPAPPAPRPASPFLRPASPFLAPAPPAPPALRRVREARSASPFLAPAPPAPRSASPLGARPLPPLPPCNSPAPAPPPPPPPPRPTSPLPSPPAPSPAPLPSSPRSPSPPVHLLPPPSMIYPVYSCDRSPNTEHWHAEIDFRSFEDTLDNPFNAVPPHAVPPHLLFDSDVNMAPSEAGDGSDAGGAGDNGDNDGRSTVPDDDARSSSPLSLSAINDNPDIDEEAMEVDEGEQEVEEVVKDTGGRLSKKGVAWRARFLDDVVELAHNYAKESGISAERFMRALGGGTANQGWNPWNTYQAFARDPKNSVREYQRVAPEFNSSPDDIPQLTQKQLAAMFIAFKDKYGDQATVILQKFNEKVFADKRETLASRQRDFAKQCDAFKNELSAISDRGYEAIVLMVGTVVSEDDQLGEVIATPGLAEYFCNSFKNPQSRRPYSESDLLGVAKTCSYRYQAETVLFEGTELDNDYPSGTGEASATSAEASATSTKASAASAASSKPSTTSSKRSTARATAAPAESAPSEPEASTSTDVVKSKYPGIRAEDKPWKTATYKNPVKLPNLTPDLNWMRGRWGDMSIAILGFDVFRKDNPQQFAWNTLPRVLKDNGCRLVGFPNDVRLPGEGSAGKKKGSAVWRMEDMKYINVAVLDYERLNYGLRLERYTPVNDKDDFVIISHNYAVLPPDGPPALVDAHWRTGGGTRVRVQNSVGDIYEAAVDLGNPGSPAIGKSWCAWGKLIKKEGEGDNKEDDEEEEEEVVEVKRPSKTKKTSAVRTPAASTSAAAGDARPSASVSERPRPRPVPPKKDGRGTDEGVDEDAKAREAKEAKEAKAAKAKAAKEAKAAKAAKAKAAKEARAKAKAQAAKEVEVESEDDTPVTQLTPRPTIGPAVAVDDDDEYVDSSSMRTPMPKPKRTREQLTPADSDYFFASDTDGGQPPGKKMRTRADGPAFVPEVQRVPEVQQGGGSKAAAKEAGETKAPKASANGHAVEKHVTFAGEYNDRPANNAEKVAARRRGMANIPRPQQLPEEAPEAPEELPIGHSRRQPTRRSARALLPPMVPPDSVIPTPVYMAAPPPQTHRTGTMYAVDGTGSPIGSVYSGNRGRSTPHYLVSNPASSSSAPLPSSSAAGLPDPDDPSVTVTLQPEELRVIRDQLQSFQAMQRQIRHLEDQLRKGQK